MHFHWDIHFSAGEGEWREKRLNIAGPRDEGSGMMNRLHVWTLDYGNIECGKLDVY